MIDVIVNDRQIDYLGDDEENAALAGVAQGLALDPTVQYQIRTDTSQGIVLLNLSHIRFITHSVI